MANNDFPLTTGSIARLCHVSAGTVLNWIWSGKLRAYATPGGHYRVAREELMSFLKESGMPAPAEVEEEAARRVLVVEDDPSVVEVVSRALAEAGRPYRVEVATNGFEAGLKAAEFKPDLVILDIRLPGMDGFAVCRRIKAHGATRQARVLAVTGYPSPEVREKMFACGAEGFLPKPFSVEELLREAERLLALPRNGRGPRGPKRSAHSSEPHSPAGGAEEQEDPLRPGGRGPRGPKRASPPGGKGKARRARD